MTAWPNLFATHDEVIGAQMGELQQLERRPAQLLAVAVYPLHIVDIGAQGAVFENFETSASQQFLQRAAGE